jgi:hypothetical protein
MTEETDEHDRELFASERAAADRRIPEIEPEVIHDLMLTGLTAVKSSSVFHFIGWADTLDTYGEPTERRITVRFSLPDDGARALLRDLSKMRK